MYYKKGISLIALVITIIILLVLAGITITLTIGPDGMLEKARGSKLDSRYASIMDKVKVRETDLAMAFARGEEGEHHSNFISRLKSEGLIEDDDYHSDNYRTLYIGKTGENTYKYIIDIMDGTIDGKKISDAIEALPDASKPGKEYLKNMVLLFETYSNNEEVVLPISNTQNLTINWDLDDENSVAEPANKTQNPTHLYQNSGLHKVQIIGEAEPGTSIGGLPEWEYDNDSYINDHIIGIEVWGENNFEKIHSFGENIHGEIPLPSINSFKYVTEFKRTFQREIHMVSEVEEDVKYEYAVNLSNDDVNFESCIAYYEPELVIPKNFFANAPKVKHMDLVFSGRTDLEKIPKDLFLNLPNAKTFKRTFAYCFELETRLTNDFFKNSTEVESFEGTFFDCSSITGSIPEKIFEKTTKVISFKEVFAGCYSLTGNFPEKLFENCTKVESFEGTFSECSSITGGIPEKLFTNCPDVLTFEKTFNRCDELDGILPTNLFDSNLKATNFEKTFYFCRELKGTAPRLWERGNLTGWYSCYFQCLSLDNYHTEIFGGWK